MKKSVKLIIILLFVLSLFLVVPNIVHASNNEVITPSNEDYIGGQIWMYQANGEEIEGMTGAAEFGWSEINVPTYNDYTNCYFQFETTESVGKSVTVKNLGTFVFDKKVYDNNESKDMYIYKCKVADPTKFYKPTDNQEFQYTITSEVTNKTYACSFELEIYGSERTFYKVNSDNMSIQIGVVSDTDLTFKAEQIPDDSDTYLKVIRSVPEGNKYLNSFLLFLEGGNYKGDLTITFIIGEQYNGKKINITHLKDNSYQTLESFERTVENGKVTITVKSLSPFVLSLAKTEQQNTGTQEENTNVQDNNKQEDTNKSNQNKEKDDTPKTGVANFTIIAIVLVSLSVASIIVFKKK